MSFIVRHDSAALGRKLRDQASRHQRAAVSAINRTAKSLKTMAVREIQLNAGASSQKTIRRNLRIDRATAQRPRAELFARSGRLDRIPIFELKPRPKTVATGRQRGPGVRYGPRQKLIPGSFIQRMKSGHVGVFVRVGPAGKQGIVESRLISVALLLRRPRIVKKMRTFIKEHLPVELARAFKFATKA